MTGEGGLPTFVLIGAAKAGTTSLYHYLGEHPEIYMSPVKEPRFFALEGHALDFRGPSDDRLHGRTTTTLSAYRALFAGVRHERAVGEASVIYLAHPRAAGALARTVRDAKLVAVLRDPAERAYSSFLYHTRDGFEPAATFEEALRDEPERLAAGWYPGWAYRGQGFYFRHLSRFLEVFPREQLRVYTYEELDRRPLELLRDLFGFLDVDTAFVPDVSIRWNPSGRPRSPRMQRLLTRPHPLKEAVKRIVPERIGHRAIERVQRRNLVRPELAPETRADLVAGYADDIRRLEELIDRDLSAWLR